MSEREYDRIQNLSADELENRIMKEIWADFPLGSTKGLLIEAAVDRLREIERLKKKYNIKKAPETWEALMKATQP